LNDPDTWQSVTLDTADNPVWSPADLANDDLHDFALADQSAAPVRRWAGYARVRTSAGICIGPARQSASALLA
ncbi:MAG TPA: hypothetical protein VFP48_10735, partial [Steroidobacteraceae bacterium]|nr:hypothetical protein [Steroidobacteraceae bacterium]